eukprot:gene11663-biopygen11555
MTPFHSSHGTNTCFLESGVHLLGAKPCQQHLRRRQPGDVHPAMLRRVLRELDFPFAVRVVEPQVDEIAVAEAPPVAHSEGLVCDRGGPDAAPDVDEGGSNAQWKHLIMSCVRLSQALPLIKCYDSERGGVPSAHTGFRLPQAEEAVAAGCPPRESIEARTVVFWPKGGGGAAAKL